MANDQPTPPARSEDRREPDPLGYLFQRCRPAPLDPKRRERLRRFVDAALERR